MTTDPAPASPPLELVCPAGSLPALNAAVDNGADCVYLGFRDATNARDFAGLNVGADAIAFYHRHFGIARAVLPRVPSLTVRKEDPDTLDAIDGAPLDRLRPRRRTC